MENLTKNELVYLHAALRMLLNTDCISEDAYINMDAFRKRFGTYGAETLHKAAEKIEKEIKP